MKSVIGNMIFDTILLAIAVGLVCILIDHPISFWQVIGLVGIFMGYGATHAIINMKRIGYRA